MRKCGDLCSFTIRWKRLDHEGQDKSKAESSLLEVTIDIFNLQGLSPEYCEISKLAYDTRGVLLQDCCRIPAPRRMRAESTKATAVRR
jgi:hypothetical protein